MADHCSIALRPHKANTQTVTTPLVDVRILAGRGSKDTVQVDGLDAKCRRRRPTTSRPAAGIACNSAVVTKHRSKVEGRKIATMQVPVTELLWYLAYWIRP